jgi:hypothetical protein
MQRVIIPNVCEDELIGGSFNHLVQVVEQTRQAQPGDTAVWDFHEVTFLHPFFLAPLAIFRQQAGVDIRCENITLQMQSYLNGIHFDRMLHFENATRETAEHVMAQYADRNYLPLCSFSMTDDNKDAFCSIARNIIVRQTHVGAAVTTPISYFLSELIDNIYEHSGSAFHRYERQSLNYYANISRFFHWDGTLILLRIPVNAPEGFNYINYLE